MVDTNEHDALAASLSAEQRAEIEPLLQDGETLAAFVAAAIRTELAWRKMTRSGTEAAPAEAEAETEAR